MASNVFKHVQDSSEFEYHVLDQVTAIPAAGLTTVATIDCAGRDKLIVQVTPGTNALDDFDVFGKVHPGGAEMNATPANWAALSNEWRVTKASGNLAALGAASTGWFEMTVTGFKQVVIKVSGSVADTTTLDLAYSLS